MVYQLLQEQLAITGTISLTTANKISSASENRSRWTQLLITIQHIDWLLLMTL